MVILSNATTPGDCPTKTESLKDSQCNTLLMSHGRLAANSSRPKPTSKVSNPIAPHHHRQSSGELHLKQGKTSSGDQKTPIVMPAVVNLNLISEKSLPKRSTSQLDNLKKMSATFNVINSEFEECSSQHMDLLR